MTINLDSNKEAVLKKIFNVSDLTPIIEKVLSDWADNQINLKASGEQTTAEKISILNEKFKTKK